MLRILPANAVLFFVPICGVLICKFESHVTVRHIAYAAIGPKAYGTRVLMSHSLGRYDVYFKSVANWPTRPFIFRFRNWVAEGLWS